MYDTAALSGYADQHRSQINQSADHGLGKEVDPHKHHTVAEQANEQRPHIGARNRALAGWRYGFGDDPVG